MGSNPNTHPFEADISNEDYRKFSMFPLQFALIVLSFYLLVKFFCDYTLNVHVRVENNSCITCEKTIVAGNMMTKLPLEVIVLKLICCSIRSVFNNNLRNICNNNNSFLYERLV